MAQGATGGLPIQLAALGGSLDGRLFGDRGCIFWKGIVRLSHV